jgi:2-keto-4-pentenoate hydratase
VGSALFLIGKESKIKSIDLNDIIVVLTRDGNEENRGKGSDPLGDQWSALLWLVNKALAQGWRIEPGHLFITGALGKMIPANSGIYNADFGTLGKIKFQIK